MRVDALPPADQIDHQEIRQAAEKYEAARRQLKERQQAVRDLEDGRERAEWLDAEAAEKAIASGSPAPKRHHVADHEKRADELAHALKVAELSTKRALSELQAVFDTHGPEWAESLAIRSENLEQSWNEAVSSLISLHGERTALNACRRKLGADVAAIGSIRLRPAQLVDSLSGDKLSLTLTGELGGGARRRQRLSAAVGDVLAALAALGVAEEIPAVAGVPGLGEALARSFAHTQTIDRGHSVDEAKRDGPVGNELFVQGRPVRVHVPDGGGTA